MGSKTSLSEHLDLSRRALDELIDRGLIDLSLPLQKNRVAYIRYLRDKAAGWGETNNQYKLMEERARLAHHQANKTAIEEEALKGKLVLVEQVEQDWITRTLKFRAAMLAIPTKIASVALAAKSMTEVKDWCAKEVNRALDELSRRPIRNTRISEPQSGRGDKTSANANGKRVGRTKAPAKPRGKRRTGTVAQ